MTFDEALTLSGLNFYGKFTEQVANIVAVAAATEKIQPADLAFTWFHESSFDLAPMPQTNKSTDVWDWDIGCVQINLGWSCRSGWIQEYKTTDLSFASVFGTKFKDEQGNPLPFNGQPLANLRLCARKLLSTRGSREDRLVHYTGPAHQDSRRASWQDLGPKLDVFFGNWSV